MLLSCFLCCDNVRENVKRENQTKHKYHPFVTSTSKAKKTFRCDKYKNENIRLVEIEGHQCVLRVQSFYLSTPCIWGKYTATEYLNSVFLKTTKNQLKLLNRSYLIWNLVFSNKQGFRKEFDEVGLKSTRSPYHIVIDYRRLYIEPLNQHCPTLRHLLKLCS